LKKLLLIINTTKLIGPVIEKAVTHNKHYISLQDTCQCHLVVFSKIFIIYNLLQMKGLERKRQILAQIIFGREEKADIGPNYFWPRGKNG